MPERRWLVQIAFSRNHDALTVKSTITGKSASEALNAVMNEHGIVAVEVDRFKVEEFAARAQRLGEAE